MTETDPDAIGPDGTVRLRCYLPSADTVWLSASCDGPASCGHVAPIGIQAAIRAAEYRGVGAKPVAATRAVW